MNDASESSGPGRLRIVRRFARTPALVIALNCLPRPAVGAPERVSVHSDSTCPGAVEVGRELKRSMNETAIVSESEGAPNDDVVVVTDGGAHYTISAGGEERIIDDPDRDCSERARVAAVFAAMALDPPVIEEAAPSRVAPPPPPTSDQPDVERQKETEHAEQAAWLSFAGLATWAGSSHQPFAVGPELGLGLGRNTLKVQLNMAITSPSTLRFGDAEVELTRLPANVTVYVRANRPTLEGAVGLGLSVEGLHFAGRGSFTPEAHTRVQVGVRTAAQARLVLSEGWSTFCEVSGTFVPSTYDLELAPEGVVGSAPAVWLGVSLGVSMGLL